MAAKTQPPRRPPDIQEIVALHVRCSQRLDDLLEECRALKAAGNVAAARRVLKQAEAIRAGLRALEAEVRMAGGQRRDKRF